MTPIKDARLTNSPVPEGAKQVEVVRRERFSERLPDEEAVAEAGQSNGESTATARIICPDCGESSSRADWDGNGGECPNPDCDDDDDDDQEVELSPAARLLASLGKAGSGVNEETLALYIVRLPDPPGSRYARPCPSGETLGHLPFDEALTSKEAIENAIQNLHGGGKYQIKVLVNNLHRTSWTTLPPLADPARQDTERAVQTIPAAEHPSASMQLDEALGIAERIVKLNRAGRPEPAALPAAAAVPSTPQDQLSSMTGMIAGFAALMTAVKEIGGSGGSPAPHSTVKDWTEGLSDLAKGLGLQQVVPQVTQFALAMVVENRAAAQRAAAEAAARQTTPAPPAEQAGLTPATGVAGAPRAWVRPPEPSIPLAEAVAPAPPASPAPPDAASLALYAALEIVIRQMQVYEDNDADDDDGDATAIATAADALTSIPEETLQPIFEFSPAVIIAQLSMERPDWAHIAQLETAITFVNALIVELNKRKGKGSVDVAGLESLLTEEPEAETKEQAGPIEAAPAPVVARKQGSRKQAAQVVADQVADQGEKEKEKPAA